MDAKLFSLSARAGLVLIFLPLLTGCAKKTDVKTELNHLEQAFSAANTNDPIALAVTAIRKEDYATGVITLDNLKRVPGMTSEQLISVQRAMEAVTAGLVTRAARGDAKAQADLAAIERSRSQ
jgi:hypothetical protein